MLKSSGYFSNILCPYYTSGLCERPHCHYKHAHTTVPAYIPTPVYKTVSRSSDTAVKRKSVSKSTIPEYKPTPISQLKKLKANNLSEAETSALGKKRTESESSQSSSQDGKQVKSESKTKDNLKKVKSPPASKPKNQKPSSRDGVNQEKEPEKGSSSKQAVSKPVKVEDKKKSTAAEKPENQEKEPDDKVVKEKVKENCSKGATRKVENSSSDDETPQSHDSPPPSDDEPDDSGSIKGDNEKRTVDDQNTITIPTKKQRIAHQASDSPRKPSVTTPKKSQKMSPAQVMFNRFATANSNAENLQSAQLSGKKRVAHNLKPSSSPRPPASSSVNTIKTDDKPTELKRPTLPMEFGGKVPIALRQKYLNKLIDECLKCCPTTQKAYERGLQEEKSVFTRSPSKAIYINLAANTIKRLRDEGNNSKEPKECKPSVSAPKVGNRLVSHEAILNGPQAVGCSIEKRTKSLTISDLSDAMLFKLLMKFAMTKEQLKEHGYPLPNPAKPDEVILPTPENKLLNNFLSSRRNCGRCKTAFQVNANGRPIKKEVCIYHPGRLWNERINKSVERRYSCCKGDTSSGGCCSATSHVVDGYGHPDYLKGYVTTKPKESSETSNFHGIYALDCEMCYTTAGLELTRVSVIDHNCKSVYESLVKPSNEILDYNTKFSGIQEGDLDNVTTKITDVQEKLLSFVSDKTILIGHSLESDFKALKLLHETVIDTAAVFPHNRGLPYRRALRTLIAEYLKKIIQDEVGGHDSQEDAISCMQLVLWKIGQELSKIKKVS